MSSLNGDKSRFNRERKQKIRKRERNRELLKKLIERGKGRGAAAATSRTKEGA
jgi:hypothetical protein